LQRAKLKRDRVEIMVHEPFLAFHEGSRKQDLAAAVHRVMVVILMKAASRVWVSIPDWEVQLRPFVLGGNKTFGWLPVPSTIPVIDDPEGVARIRAQYASPGVSLIGHFGAYDRYMSELMLELLPLLLTKQDGLSVILLGRGGKELREQLILRHPELSHRLYATGMLAAENISRHISACDVMLQPYQDGVSGRRTSVMTALSHGVPVVTTIGRTTEKCWVESQAVKLTKVGDVGRMVDMAMELLADGRERSRLGATGRVLYEERFAVRQTITKLREAVG
jgi:glycosyltransferase involved in cell wall biosynthesis